MPVLVKDGKPISGGGAGGNSISAGTNGGHHPGDAGGHPGDSEVGAAGGTPMTSLLDVGLTGHHPSSAGHHFR